MKRDPKRQNEVRLEWSVKGIVHAMYLGDAWDFFQLPTGREIDRWHDDGGNCHGVFR